MTRTIGLKLLHLVPVLFLVSLATFFMIDLIPGDPAVAIAGPEATPEQLEEIRVDLGLDKPVVERYFNWLGDTVTGDLGQSLIPPVQDVSDMIKARLPVTLQIAVMAMAMSFLISIPIALWSAHSPGDRFDRIANAGAFASISIPSFLAALLLIFFFVFHQDIVKWTVLLLGAALLIMFARRAFMRSREYPDGREKVRFNLIAIGSLIGGVLALFLLLSYFPSFPRQGFVRITAEEGVWENLRHSFLPALTLAMIEAAIFMRLLRGDLLETLREDFILSARAKGMPTWRILLYDALRPSSFSLVTIAGVAFGRAIGGTVIVETIFNLPGMGTLIVNAISSRDYVVVQACVLVLAVFYVAVNAMVDVSYAFIDPRIRRDST